MTISTRNLKINLKNSISLFKDQEMKWDRANLSKFEGGKTAITSRHAFTHIWITRQVKILDKNCIFSPFWYSKFYSISCNNLHVRLLGKPCDMVFQSHLLVAHFLIRHPWLFYVVIRYEIPLNFLFLFLYCLKVNEHSPTGHIAGESTACYVWKVMCLDQNHLLVKLYRNISLIYALVTLEHNIQQLPSRRFNGEFLVDYFLYI